MKKVVLIGLMTTPFWVMAQQKNVVTNGTKTGATDNKVVTTTTTTTTNNPKGTQPSTTLSPSTINYPMVKIGESKYDLQTNASIGRRVMEYAGGKVSVVWTYSNENDPWNDRGTGYNHFNGTSWGSTPSVRIEGGTGTTNRTGWPNLGQIGSGEYVFGHAPVGGFRKSTNGTIGSNTWTLSPILLGDNTTQYPIWGRVANNGNTIHVVANYTTTAGNKVIKGVNNPMVYSRSLDGGTTWPIQNITLPGYDSTLTLYGGGDNYAIDVRDSIVAIVAGGVVDHVVLWKSTDNGTTFMRIIIDSMPYGVKDTFSDKKYRGNDGSMEVVIDNNGKIQLFWGMSVVAAKPSDSSYSYYPSVGALMHWSEYTNKIDTIAAILDRNNTDTIEIEPSTWQITTTNTGAAARYGSTCLVTMPSAGVDASNYIYVVYSAPVEEDVTPLDPFENYRDVYVVYSKDNGATWAAPQNLTKGQGFEDVFGCINKQISNKLHLIWQRDGDPGTALQNGDLPGINDIMYAAIPTADILNNSIGGDVGLSVKNVHANDLFSVSQNFPNPFSNETVISIAMKKGAEVTFTITNMLGQTVTTSVSNLKTGLNDITVDGNSLEAGVYFYTITSGNFSETRKMIVQ